MRCDSEPEPIDPLPVLPLGYAFPATEINRERSGISTPGVQNEERKDETMVFILFYIFCTVALIFIVSGFLGAPFVPSDPKKVAEIIKVAEIRPGERAADLGSGDGRVVMAMAKAGAEAHGYEINPVLVLWSLAGIYLAGLRGRAHIHWGSYWKRDLSSYELVTIYGAGNIMRRIREKLCRELPRHSRIVCNTFRLPEMRPLRSHQNIHLYVPHYSETPGEPSVK